AQRIEIAAGINGAIHATRLFGRHVGKGAGNDFRRRQHLALARQPRRNSEAREPYVAGVVDEHIFRLDVLMYEAMPMDLAKCCRQANSNTQDAGHIERLPVASLENSIQRFTAWVFEYEDSSPFVTTESQRPGCPSGIEFSGE